MLSAGVRIVSGRGLVKLLGEGPAILDVDQVQAVEDLADRKLRDSWSWEGQR